MVVVVPPVGVVMLAVMLAVVPPVGVVMLAVMPPVGL